MRKLSPEMKKLQQGSWAQQQQQQLPSSLLLLSRILLLLLLQLLLFLQPAVCRIAPLGRVVVAARRSPGTISISSSSSRSSSSAGSNPIDVLFVCGGGGDGDVVVAPDAADFLEKLNVSLLLGIDSRSSTLCRRRRSGDGGGGRRSSLDSVLGGERENNGAAMQCWSDHYIRGFPMEKRSVDYYCAGAASAALSVKATTQGGERKQQQQQEFPSAMTLQKNPSIILTPCCDSSHTSSSPATQFPLSRRSLQAQTGQATAATISYLECRRGHLWLGCDWWENQVVGALVCIAGVLMVVIACAHSAKDNATHADFLESIASLPPRFSYTKLQKSTKNFSRKLGDGAFGSVYEGFLPNGLRVAVKMLDKTSVQGEKQFRAEVASMGAIRHLNLVRLHGFCSEGSHRLLVYEFMANGSLDSWLFGKKHGEKLLDWEQRLNIALGTARALAYLHEECSDHIIHLDVKPENILLDHQFCPKLSDFGLAKLMDKEQSRVVTSMRGTPGYLAPEWLLPQAAVTAKTDVYSFGMVLLELISGRENTNFSLGKEQWYFPAWAFKLVGEGRTMELLDKRLHVEEVEYFHKDNALRAIHTALLCIQDDPVLRPSMSRVVHMLQGHVEPEPLNSRQAAIHPPRRLLSAFTASRSDMKAEDVRYEPAAPTVPSSGPIVLPQPAPVKLEPSTPQEMDAGTNQGADKMSPLPPAALSSYQGHQSSGNKQTRMVQAHAVDTGQNSIPPWPVKGDVILLRGPGGDLYGVVREVRVQTKQMRLALLHRIGSELRWSVWEEETLWRHWNESIKTLDFWVVVRWSTIPGRGIEKFPVEWMAR